MMYSFLPVPEDQAGAIITLNGLGHERRSDAGIPVDARGHGIQAGYVRLATTIRIHMNPPNFAAWQRSNSRNLWPSTSLNKMCQPELSTMCLKIDRTVFIEHRREKSPRSDPLREPTGVPTYTLPPPRDHLP